MKIEISMPRPLTPEEEDLATKLFRLGLTKDITRQFGEIEWSVVLSCQDDYRSPLPMQAMAIQVLVSDIEEDIPDGSIAPMTEPLQDAIAEVANGILIIGTHALITVHHEFKPRRVRDLRKIVTGIQHPEPTITET